MIKVEFIVLIYEACRKRPMKVVTSYFLSLTDRNRSMPMPSFASEKLSQNGTNKNARGRAPHSLFGTVDFWHARGNADI